MASHIQIETDLYEQKQVLRWTSDEFLSQIDGLTRAFAKVAAQLERLNDHEETESKLSRKLAKMMKAIEEGDGDA